MFLQNHITNVDPHIQRQLIKLSTDLRGHKNHTGKQLSASVTLQKNQYSLFNN